MLNPTRNGPFVWPSIANRPLLTDVRIKTKKNIGPTSGKHQANIRQTSGKHQANIRQTSGKHQANIRQTSDSGHRSDERLLFVSSAVTIKIMVMMMVVDEKMQKCMFVGTCLLEPV